MSCGPENAASCSLGSKGNAWFIFFFNLPLSLLSSKSVLKLYSETQRDKGRLVVAIRFFREEVQRETRRGDEEAGGWDCVLASVPTKNRVR